MQNNLRQIRSILYQLKKDYGASIDLRNPFPDEVDRETGVVNIQYDIVKIKKAIVLPVKAIPSFVYGLSFAAANRNFSYGGIYGVHTRNIIVEGKDVADDFLIKEKTQAILDSELYVLKDYIEAGSKIAYLLTVTTLSSLEKVNG